MPRFVYNRPILEVKSYRQMIPVRTGLDVLQLTETACFFPMCVCVCACPLLISTWKMTRDILLTLRKQAWAGDCKVLNTHHVVVIFIKRGHSSRRSLNYCSFRLCSGLSQNCLSSLSFQTWTLASWKTPKCGTDCFLSRKLYVWKIVIYTRYNDNVYCLKIVVL